MEGEISELEAQLESDSKARDDAVRQHRKLQTLLKDAQLGSEEAHKAQEELSVHVKELEKRLRNIEGELTQSQEVCTCCGMYMLWYVHVHVVVCTCCGMYMYMYMLWYVHVHVVVCTCCGTCM